MLHLNTGEVTLEVTPSGANPGCVWFRVFRNDVERPPVWRFYEPGAYRLVDDASIAAAFREGFPGKRAPSHAVECVVRIMEEYGILVLFQKE